MVETETKSEILEVEDMRMASSMPIYCLKYIYRLSIISLQRMKHLEVQQ